MMDYTEAEQVMITVLDFVFSYMSDYPQVFELETGLGLSQSDVEAAYNKVKNG